MSDEAHERSRLWFQRIAEASPNIIFVLDVVAGRYVYSNGAVARILGYDAAELREMDQAFRRVIPPEDLDAASRFYAAMRHAQRGEVRQLSHRAIRRDGGIRWMENHVTPFSRDPDGLVRQVIGIAADVTDRTLLEREHGNLANLIEHSSDFIGMAALDGTLTYINAAGRRMIGMDDARDVASLKITDYVPAEWLERFRNEIIPSVVRNGQWEGEMQLMHLVTGERIDVSRSTYVVRDPATAAPVGFGTVTRDITQQKKAEAELRRSVTEARRAEAALRQSEENFRTLADNISQLAWMADATGWIFWYNRRWFEYTGTTLRQMEGWGWHEVHHPDHLDRVLDKFRRAVGEGQPWEDTFPLRGRDGSFRWFLSRALPIRDDEGHVVRWFGTNTDVNELRETQEALRAADRLKDEFLATLSHELRTPLTAILGWTHMLLSQNLGAYETQFAIETIHRSATAQAELIEDVLDISRITTGKMQLERRAADPGVIADAALATVGPAAEAKGTRLHARIDRDLGAMYVDPDRLQQILWNLLSNAIKFSPANANVGLALYRNDGMAVFEVSDDGPGIAADFLPHIFQRFRQGDSSSRRAYSGLGVGLALVKELADLHGGTIVVESTLGAGSLFRVTIPIVTPPQGAPAA